LWGGLFLIVSPWLTEFPSPLRVSLVAFLALGAALTFAGFGMRLSDPAMRLLSTPDDYFSLALVTLFLASGAMSAAQAEFLPAFWAISGITMAYVPLGKLRHFLYFFYERTFLGLVLGRRGVLEWRHE
jgi:nitrate reductase gamma subunit